MEEKGYIKINLSTLFLIIALIIIVIMGIFIYKLYNDKEIEIEKSSNLQNKLDIISNPINTENSDKEVIKSNSTEADNESTSFSNEEIKKAIQDCLNLESAKTCGPQTILYTLGFYKEGVSYYDNEKSAKTTGYIKTIIKFNDFKNSIHKYMTEQCYQKQWKDELGDFFINEDEYLCYQNVGASGISYKVVSIEKQNTNYVAHVIASSEGPDSNVTVKFTVNNSQCIIESYDFEY